MGASDDWIIELRDIIHAAGTELPKDLTPPSERSYKVPNRKERRASGRRKDADSSDR